MNLTTGYILLTIIASLLSGITGIFISFFFYSRMERRKMKIDTARKLFGNKHALDSKEFQEALNEIMIVFSDCDAVIKQMQSFFEIVSIPQEARGSNAANEALIKLMKAMCVDIGIKYKDLPDSYYLSVFRTRSEVNR